MLVFLGHGWNHDERALRGLVELVQGCNIVALVGSLLEPFVRQNLQFPLELIFEAGRFKFWDIFSAFFLLDGRFQSLSVCQTV